MKRNEWFTNRSTKTDIDPIGHSMPTMPQPYCKEFATIKELIADAEKYHNAEELSVRDGILTLITQQIESLKQIK